MNGWPERNFSIDRHVGTKGKGVPRDPVNAIGAHRDDKHVIGVLSSPPNWAFGSHAGSVLSRGKSQVGRIH